MGSQAPVERSSGSGSAIISALTKAAWFVLAAYIVWNLLPLIEKHLEEGDLEEIQVFELRIRFAKSAAHQLPEGRVDIPGLEAVWQRLEHSRAWLRNVRIIWIDDKHPLQNVIEREAFQSLGFAIDTVRDSEDARKLLKKSKYNMIISDIGGAGEHKLKILEFAKGFPYHSDVPLIFYVEKLDPDKRPDVFGMTNKFDQLTHLILDALQRQPLSGTGARVLKDPQPVPEDSFFCTRAATFRSRAGGGGGGRDQP